MLTSSGAVGSRAVVTKFTPQPRPEATRLRRCVAWSSRVRGRRVQAMTTAAWIVVSGAGLFVGFLVGIGFRRRAVRTAEARSTSTTAPQTALEPVPDVGADKPGDVIELRRPTGDAPPLRLGTPQGTTADAFSTQSQMDRSEPGRPLLENRDADIIDLTGRVSVLIPIHNLQFVRGIGPEVDRVLRSHRIHSLLDLTELTADNVAKVGADQRAPSAKRIRKKLQPRAQQMLDAAGKYNIAEPPDNGELRRVQGIGTTMMRWLETHDITSLEDLAALDKAQTRDLSNELTDDPNRIREQRWVNQARALLVPT
jgi:predicted flap endonuclease-1-like 5' DNA nuclease